MLAKPGTDHGFLPDGKPWSVPGFALLAVGLLLYVVGRSQGLALFEVGSHLPVIVGVLLVMRGPRAVRRLAFPLLFLLFLVPLPGFILETVTTPLKNVVKKVRRLDSIARQLLARSDQCHASDPSVAGDRYSAV